MSGFKILRRPRCTALLAAACVILAAASGAPEARAQAELPVLTVGVTPSQVSLHPAAIFAQTGFDKKNGWAIKTFPRATPAALLNDFMTGAYEAINFGGLNSFAQMYDKGAPIKLIQAVAIYPYPFEVRSDSGINTIKDLKGRKLGVPRASYVYSYIYAIMKANGMELEKDTQVQDVAFVQAPLLLERGDFDGTLFLPEHAIIWDKKAPGKFEMLFDAGREFAKVIGQPNSYLYMAVRDDWLKQHPGLINNVMASYKEYGEYVAANPKKVAETLMKSTTDGGADLSPDVGAALYEGYKGIKLTWVSIPVKNIKDAIKKELQVYVDLKVIDKMPDDGFFLDTP